MSYGPTFLQGKTSLPKKKGINLVILPPFLPAAGPLRSLKARSESEYRLPNGSFGLVLHWAVFSWSRLRGSPTSGFFEAVPVQCPYGT